MAAAAQHDTVWVGFLDVVPVIGMVKEGVEWVMALYEENKEVVNEKEKAIRELPVRWKPEALVEPMKGLTLHKIPNGRRMGPDGEAASASALQDVKEVKLEELVQYVRSVTSKRRTPSSKPPEKEQSERIQKIQNEMIEKIKLINPNYRLAKDLKIELQGSKRGEHVFNNNILKFHSKLLSKNLPEKIELSDLSEYERLIKDEACHTLTRETKNKSQPATETEIQDNMVVKFDDVDFYVNVNSILYGEYSKGLRSALLCALCDQDINKQNEQRVNKIIHFMNAHEIYVDEFAKAKWIYKEKEKKERENNKLRFDRVKNEVTDMYRDKRGFDWCTRVKGIISHLFKDDLIF